MVDPTCFKIPACMKNRRECMLLSHLVTLFLIYMVINTIPCADAVIRPQNRPATVEEWERVQALPKKRYMQHGKDTTCLSNDNILWQKNLEADFNAKMETPLISRPNNIVKQKIIVIWEDWEKKTYERNLNRSDCSTNNCIITTDRSKAPYADAILFKYHFDMPTFERPPNQVWVLNILEPPLISLDFEFPDVFNWTSTYRRDSDVPMPYDYWVYYDQNVKFAPIAPNIAAGKTKKVAWYVSNCNAASNRLEYAKELSKYIEVDIYGKCGTKTCDRSSTGKCLDMLKKNYKFYLSFENSICKEYVTEKLFYPLKYNILPIAMGATKEFYATVAPENSYIHVDDFNSPKELADYLHILDKDDALYNSYFQFHGTGEFLIEYGRHPCRLCTALHSKFPTNIIKDVNAWRNSPGECSFRPQGTGLPRIPPLQW